MTHTIAIYTDAHGAICIFRQEAARYVGADMLRVSDWVTVEFPSIKADDIAAEIRTLDDKVGQLAARQTREVEAMQKRRAELLAMMPKPAAVET